MADLLCPTCGRTNSSDREFCDLCGNPLDGALSIEPEDSSLRNDIFKDESQAGQAGDQDSIDEASRLDSFFTEEDAGSTSQSESQSSLTEPDDEGSRLDQYLAAEPSPPSPDTSPEPPSPEAEDDISRLDDYFTRENGGPDAAPAPESSGQDEESARLDDYFSEDIPLTASQIPDSQPEGDESDRLDDFFADDPFKSPDPFQESDQPQAPASDQTEDEFDPFKIPPEELNLTDELMEPGGGLDQDRPSLDSWDLFSDETEPEFSADQNAQTEPESADELDWLDPGPVPDEDQPSQFLESDPSESPEVPDEENIEEDQISPPAAAQEAAPAEAPVAETSPGEWAYLDSEPESTEQESADKPPESPSSSPDFNFLDPEPAGQPDQAASGDSVEEEWGFLDPGDPDDQLEPTDQQPDSEDSAAEGELDWLDPATEPDLSGGEESPDFDSSGFGEDSGWLDMLQSPEDRQAAAEESAEPEKPQTDWLDKIKRLNKSSDLVDEDSSFPDWLAVSDQQPPEEPEEPPEDIEEAAPSEVPEWLKVDDDASLNEFLRRKDLTNEEYTPQITEESEDSANLEDDEPASGLSDSQQIKFPSWAEEERAKNQAGGAAGEGSPGSGSAAEPFQLEEEYIDDLFSDELPEWLTAASSEEIAQPYLDDLAQGELPGWVEAMRPVVESSDATGLPDDEEYIENYGPLAGIPSVLPAEAEIGIDLEEAAKKPLDLLATPNHQEFVNLLKKIIGDENNSRTIQRPAPLQTQRVLRWLITIVLLFATISTVIFGSVIDTQPPSAAQVQGSGYGALYDQVENLSDSQPVLIAFDYQPASAGELHAAAASVVDHLMEQETYLSFVSTQPTGPALAEQFLDTTQAEHDYQHTQKYINLGYLPGESAGLLSFMIAPKQIIPLAFDGSNAWDSPPLAGVNGINDFNMILVITDDPNTAKIWIEQVAVRLEDTPLTMVVSAQAEPLIQPYFRSSPQPLAGYVAGVLDSMNYEGLSGRPNQASQIWLPFNIGIIISVGIIFVGGLANGILSLFSRHRTRLLGEEQ